MNFFSFALKVRWNYDKSKQGDLFALEVWMELVAEQNVGRGYARSAALPFSLR
jgi:hypothetical protein